MLPVGDIDIYRRSTPYVTYGLITVSIVVFLYELYLGGSLFFTDSYEVARFFYQWGVIPKELSSGLQMHQLTLRTEGLSNFNFFRLDVSSPAPTWVTVFSSMFIHGGWIHLGGNLLYLWVLGANIEDRFGHVKFLIFYLCTGLAAVWTQVAFNPDAQAPMIGASGAVSGVTGAYLMLFPYNRIRTLVIFVFIMAVDLPAAYLLGFWFILQIFQGVGSLGPGAQLGGVAYWAHVGGFLAGLLVVALYKFVRHDPLWPKRPSHLRKDAP